MAIQDHLAFTIDEVERLTGFSYSQLRTLRKNGIVNPAYEDWERPLFSFRDLVALRAISKLRQRVSLQAIGRLHRYLTRYHEHPWSRLRIGLAGRELVFFDPKTERWQSNRPEGQFVFDEIIEFEQIAEETQSAVREARTRTPEQIGATSQNRRVMRNARVIAGTRVPTATIVGFLAAGRSYEEILANFPSLRREDIDAAVRAEEESKKTG